MKHLKIGACLLMLLGQWACSQDAKNGPPKKLLAEIQRYEAVAANNPTNYSANYALSQLYTGYHLWLATNSMADVESYRKKALASTESALSVAPNIYSRVFLAMTFEQLGEPDHALPIYKDFLVQAETNKGEILGNTEVDARLRTKVQEESAALVSDVKRRVHAIESR